MQKRYDVQVRPCSTERKRFRYTLITDTGAPHIHSQLSFGSREVAQRAAELQATKLSKLAALLV